MSKKYNKKAWYRLLKVIYFLCWGVVLLLTVGVFYGLMPKGYIIDKDSGFTCPNGQSYTWTNALTGYYSKNTTVLNTDDHVSALQSCGLYTYEYLGNKKTTDEELIKDGYSSTQIQEYKSKLVEKNRLTPPYKLDWVTDENNHNWGNTIFWTGLMFVVFILILDTIRNAIIYVVTGVWISYWWLKN